MQDIIIIGAGPAGLSAGIYAARAGLSVLVLEKRYPGGQITSTHSLENYPGVAPTSGFEFSNSLKEQADKCGVQYRQVEVTEVTQDKKVISSDGELAAKAVILALGAQPVKLGIAGEEKFIGSGISFCATCDGAFFRGLTVAVVGGGDTALEDALYLAKICQKVYIIHRRDQFRAQEILVKRAKTAENIEFILNCAPTEFLGSLELGGVKLQNKLTGELTELKVDGCFLAVGYKPDTEEIKLPVALDKNGYVIAGEDMKTNIDGIFCAGDVRVKSLRQVVTACADGAIAAKMAQDYIEVSA